MAERFGQERPIAGETPSIADQTQLRGCSSGCPIQLLGGLARAQTFFFMILFFHIDVQVIHFVAE